MTKSATPPRRIDSAFSHFTPRERTQNRDAWIRIRVNDQEREAFRDCADRFEMTVSTMIRQLVEHANTGAGGWRIR